MNKTKTCKKTQLQIPDVTQIELELEASVKMCFQSRFKSLNSPCSTDLKRQVVPESEGPSPSTLQFSPRLVFTPFTQQICWTNAFEPQRLSHEKNREPTQTRPSGDARVLNRFTSPQVSRLFCHRCLQPRSLELFQPSRLASDVHNKIICTVPTL